MSSAMSAGPGVKKAHEWVALLRREYLQAKAHYKATGDTTGLARVASRYQMAFNLVDKDCRKSRDFFQLQIDETRVLM
jgi:hypothetical protein